MYSPSMSPTRRSSNPPLDLIALREEVAEWYALKRQTTMLNAELDKRKKRLQSALEKYGQADNNGNIFLDLGESIGEHKVMQIQNQRRVSDLLNYEVAKEILEDKGMWEDMTEVVREIDQSRVKAAYFDKRISSDELAQMFPQRVVYAFYLMGEDGKAVRI